MFLRRIYFHESLHCGLTLRIEQNSNKVGYIYIHRFAIVSKLLQRVYREFRNGLSNGKEIFISPALNSTDFTWQSVGQGLTSLFHQHPPRAARDGVASKVYLFCQTFEPLAKRGTLSDPGHKLGQTVFVVEQIGSIKVARLLTPPRLSSLFVFVKYHSQIRMTFSVLTKFG